SSSYVAQTADVGSTLVATVTASNSAGSASGVSAPTAIVASAPAPPPSPPAMQTQTFSGSLNAKNPSRAFGVAVGAGTATAQLSFSRCSTLSVTLNTSNGTPVGTATGPSIVSLVSSVAAG